MKTAHRTVDNSPQPVDNSLKTVDNFMKTAHSSVDNSPFWAILTKFIHFIKVGIFPTIWVLLTLSKSELFRLLSGDFSLFSYCYCLIFKSFKYIKQQQLLSFNSQDRKFSDYGHVYRNYSDNPPGKSPAPRFTLHTEKPVAKCSAPRFSSSVRGSWISSQQSNLIPLSPLVGSGFKSCNKRSYQKLLTASLNLAIRTLIASFVDLRPMIRGTAPRNNAADVFHSRRPSRARRKKRRVRRLRDRLFCAPSQPTNLLPKGLTAWTYQN
jgi:hypothetical protein